MKTFLVPLLLYSVVAASAQGPISGTIGTAAQDPVPPPPPPIRIEEKKAAPPQRIRVSGQIQAVPDVRGPGREWASIRLTAQQLAECELKVQADPNDFQSRGRLIAALPYLDPQLQRNVQGFSRVDHLLWMIRHRPEWDGFLLEAHNGLSKLSTDAEHAQMRDAWLEQLSRPSQRAIVLHNAGMFFAIREPERASAMLQQAIALEPKEPLYVERLAVVYAYSLLDWNDVCRFCPIPAPPERAAFAQQAKNALVASDNWIGLRGAAAILLRSIGGISAYPNTELIRRNNKLGNELRMRADALSTERELPSESPRFRREGR